MHLCRRWLPNSAIWPTKRRRSIDTGQRHVVSLVSDSLRCRVTRNDNAPLTKPPNQSPSPAGARLVCDPTAISRLTTRLSRHTGNYYSLKNRHDKAVVYFRRALRLNRRYLSAWTLMGHEYVELKNTAAAIEAYRKAVGV